MKASGYSHLLSGRARRSVEPARGLYQRQGVGDDAQRQDHRAENDKTESERTDQQQDSNEQSRHVSPASTMDFLFFARVQYSRKTSECK